MTIKVGGRVFSNLRFADDIDLLVGLTRKLNPTARKYGMEIR